MIANGEKYRQAPLAEIELKRAVLQKWFTKQSFTVVALTFSILLPVVALLWSRHSLQHGRTLQGLPFQLVRQSRLIQSFIVDPEQAVPAIWSSRLGDGEASSRWASSARKLWWMAWLEDGEPLLVISGANRSDPSTFHFADALHRDTYQKNRSSQGLKPSGLEADCLFVLNSTTAVMWTSSALVSIAGPTASVMNEVSHGCVSLSLKADILSFKGPVAPRPFSAAPQSISSPHVSSFAKRKTTSSAQPFEEQPLLQLSSRSSNRLLSTLAGRQVIQEQLEKRYGVSPNLLGKLLQAPMQLTIQPEKLGPYRAGLQVVLQLQPSQQKEVEQTLATLSSLLDDRGLISTYIAQNSARNSESGKPAKDKGAPEKKEIDQNIAKKVDSNKNDSNKNDSYKNDFGKRLVWMNGDQLIGGWSVQGTGTSLTLQLSLGQSPIQLSNRSSDPSAVELRLTMLPSQLTAIGWIGPGWPKLVREAESLDLVVVPMSGHPSGSHWDWVEGALSLR